MTSAEQADEIERLTQERDEMSRLALDNGRECERLRGEIARLKRGFLMMVQADNQCRRTGRSCRGDKFCGCVLEMDECCNQRSEAT